MPDRFDDGGQGEFLASQMGGTFSEEAARKLCFEQENQIRVLKQEVEYRKKRDEKLTAIAADLTGKLADAEINLAATVSSIADALECDAHPTPEREALAQIVADIHTALHRSEAALARREAQADAQMWEMAARMTPEQGVITAGIPEEQEAEAEKLKWECDTGERAKECLLRLIRERDAIIVAADHEWALWHEKWIAALDLMGSQADRANKAEAAVQSEREACERIVADVLGEPDGPYALFMREILRRLRERAK